MCSIFGACLKQSRVGTDVAFYARPRNPQEHVQDALQAYTGFLLRDLTQVAIIRLYIVNDQVSILYGTLN